MNREAAHLWTQALDFVIEEGDSEGLEALRARVLKERPDDLELLRKFIEVEIRRKDRSALLRQVSALRDANSCLADKPAAVCAALSRLWSDSLSSLLFFEDSAGKFERVRRSLETRDCASALPVLKEIGAKEGPLLRPYLEKLLETQDCLGDGAGKAVTETRLKELRIFERDS
jgi:hypothetical protein